MSVDVSSWVWKHSDAAGAELLVLLALADIANHNGLAWPSIGTLASRTRLHEQTVRGHLHSLRDRGALSVEHVPGRSSRYVILMNTPTDMATPSDSLGGSKSLGHPLENDSVHPSSETVGAPTNSSLRGTVIEPSIEPSFNRQRASEIDAAFERVWKAWPSSRRVTTKKSMSSFVTAVRAHGGLSKLEELVVTAEQFCAVWATWPKSDERFVPMLTTWLNQERWTMPLPEVRSTGAPSGSQSKDERALNVIEMGRQMQASADPKVVGA
jgi:hypothetical protein